MYVYLTKYADDVYRLMVDPRGVVGVNTFPLELLYNRVIQLKRDDFFYSRYHRKHVYPVALKCIQQMLEMSSVIVYTRFFWPHSVPRDFINFNQFHDPIKQRIAFL